MPAASDGIDSANGAAIDGLVLRRDAVPENWSEFKREAQEAKWSKSDVEDNQVAAGAVAVRHVEGHRVHGIDMHQEGFFTGAHLPFAIGAVGEAVVAIGVEEEGVARRQLAEAGLLFFLAHLVTVLHLERRHPSRY